MTAEWDGLRRQAVRKWLHHIRACVSGMRSLEDAMMSERDRYEMLKAVRYDSEGGCPAPEHGDDLIFSHIQRIQKLVDDMESKSAEYDEAVREARGVFGRLTCHDCAAAIMDRHYIQRETWKRIADREEYSEPRVKQIADDATLECYWLIPNQWRLRIPRADD